MRCWQVWCNASRSPRGNSWVHFLACSAHFPRSWVDPVLRDLVPPSPDPRSRPCPSSPLLGARSLPGPAPWWPSFPSHLKTANVVFSADKTGEMQIGAMNIQGRVVEWHRNFGGETARVPMPPVTSLPCLSKFPLSESSLCPLTTSQNISQKACLTVSPQRFCSFQMFRNPEAFPVNQLRRRLLFPKLRRFSFASANESPRWVLCQPMGDGDRERDQ